MPKPATSKALQPAMPITVMKKLLDPFPDTVFRNACDMGIQLFPGVGDKSGQPFVPPACQVNDHAILTVLAHGQQEGAASLRLPSVPFCRGTALQLTAVGIVGSIA